MKDKDLSVKDLLYLEDMMNWNLVMNKKINSYIDFIDDEEVIELLNKIKKMHAKHFNNLLNYLN